MFVGSLDIEDIPTSVFVWAALAGFVGGMVAATMIHLVLP